MNIKHSSIEDSKLNLRLALFTGNYNHIIDGVSLTLNRLVAYLEAQGAHVLVFGPTVNEPPIHHTGILIPTPSIPAPGRSDYRISLGLPRTLRAVLSTFRPDLFHIATPDLVGYQALQLAEKWGIPAVASYHTHFGSYLDYYHLRSFEGTLWKYLSNFYDRCDQVYVPSPSVAEALRERQVTKGIRLWQRGVNIEQFNSRHRSLDWRRSLGVQDDEVLITFVGRLVWEKGLDVVADVLVALNAQQIRHHSLIVGDGPIHDTLTRRLGNTIFTGHLSGANLSRAYASSDVFLFPSETETFGNVTLEAMASGLPVVVADATGSKSLVVHGETGFLASPRSREEFLTYTAQLVQDPSLRIEMSRKACRHAAEYTWDKVMARLVSHYRDVLQTRTSGQNRDAQHVSDAGFGRISPNVKFWPIRPGSCRNAPAPRDRPVW